MIKPTRYVNPNPPSQLLTQANILKRSMNDETQNIKRKNSTSSVGSQAFTENSNDFEIPLTDLPSSPSSSRLSSNRSESSLLSSRSESSLPIPRRKKDAIKIYQEIKAEKTQIHQSSTDPLQPLTLKKIIEHEMDTNNLPNYYVFLIKDNKIINIFESTTEIILSSTYPYETHNFLPKNYITASKLNDFNSIFEITTSNIDGNFKNKQTYNSFVSYSEIITNSSVIQIVVYKYDNLSTPTTYFTYGNIFIYEYGIASTCEIVKLENALKEQHENVLQHLNKSTIPSVSINYKSVSTKTNYVKLIETIKTNIFGSSKSETINKNSVYIYFLNAIIPRDFVSIFNDIQKVKAVINILYVNISCPPPDEDKKTISIGVDILNELHKNINYYYTYKETTDLYSEYAKENRIFGTQKINKYIEILKEKNAETNFYSHFAMHIFDFFEFLMFLKDKDPGLTLINACITIYQYYYTAYTNGFNTLKLKNDLLDTIQAKIKSNLKKPYTYLQIVNPDVAEYNKKFEIRLNKVDSQIDHGVNNKPTRYNDTSMMVKYTASTLNFYDKTNNNEITKNMSNIQNTYTKEYKFGPFNKIYRPDSNEIVSNSNEFKIVIDKILEGSPMMFSFHAPSGSGKTEILKPVFISLCNSLAKKGYITLNIRFEEFFKKYDGNDESVKTQDFSLKFDTEKFKINTEISHNPYHKTRIEILNKLKNEPTQPINKDFKKTDTLETLLNYFLEEDRLIKGFPTNYNSSRSHVVCFLEMNNGTDNRYIMFDDLAGNEKEYDCDDPSDLVRFINTKTKIGKKPFYENEFDSTGEKFDLYDGGSKQSEMINQGSESELYKKIIKTACEHRYPEGNFINESLNDFRNELEYMIDVKNKDNAYYVPDIYNIGSTFKSCLQDFCFGKTNCFNFRKVKKISEPTSVIMRSVYEYLKEKQVIMDATAFYDKLEVCIFGILNISRKKNDPPVIHYNDINGVKSILYGKDEFTINCIPELFNSLKEKLELVTTDASKLKSKRESYVYDLLDICQNEIGNKNESRLTLAEIETFKSVFELIDDENAKTAIGTLEFMNRISKLNTINSICFEKNDGATYVPLYA